MEKKIIITGGSGFIGTNLLQYYLDKKITVINIDVNEPANIDHLRYHRKVDICDRSSLLKCILDFEPTHIVHLAARTDLRGSSLEQYKANTVGVSNLVEAASSLPSLEKVVFTSSMLVCEAGYIPKSENDYKANTVYGQSKVWSEEYIKNNTAIKFDWNIVRPTSIWGPWFGTPYRNFFDMLIQDRYFNIKGSKTRKTFGFVGNVVYQIDKLLLSTDKKY